MADFKSLTNTAGETIIGTNGKVNYDHIAGIPSALIDPSNHNHDDIYTSKNTIEAEFGEIMDTVAALSKALTVRPLKTKGFLNGGYKSSFVYAERVQRFNTVTETGTEVGQIGTVTCQYSPGGSSEFKGFYFGTSRNGATGNFRSTGREVDTIVYATEVETYLGNLMPHDVRATLYNIYSQSQLYVCDSANHWSSVSIVSASTTLLPVAASQSSTRQGLSSENFGYVVKEGAATKATTKYTYLTNTSSAGTTQAITHYPSGLSKDADKGYIIDGTGTANNWRVNMVTNTVSNVICFSEGFSESNTLGSEKVGFMMGGYDGAQHGKVQKMVWATEAASNVLGGSLALPQSSAGMAES